MNERIRELTEQAGAKELGADLYGDEFIGSDYADIVQEKFAELIVQECVGIAIKWVVADQCQDGILITVRVEYE